MDRRDIRMVDARRRPRFPQETAPGSFVTDELRANDLQSHRATEVGIDGLVGYPHASMPQLKRLSVLVSKNLVMLKTKLRRAIRIGIGLRPESLLQGANWAVRAVVRQ